MLLGPTGAEQPPGHQETFLHIGNPSFCVEQGLSQSTTFDFLSECAQLRLVTSQLYSQTLVVNRICRYHFGTAHCLTNAGSHSAGHVHGGGEGNHGAATPEQVARSGVPVGDHVVEGQVCQVAPVNVFGLWSFRGENKAGGANASGLRFLE